MKSLSTIAAVVAIAILGSGCAALQPVQVQPWEMGNMARSDMALEVDPLLAGYRRHTQFSKEAATGGASASAGGCGCN